jgi:hypothetical protein
MFFSLRNHTWEMKLIPTGTGDNKLTICGQSYRVGCNHQLKKSVSSKTRVPTFNLLATPFILKIEVVL